MEKLEAVDIIIGLCNGILLKGQNPTLPNLKAKDWDKVLSLAAEQGGPGGRVPVSRIIGVSNNQ